MPEGITCSNCLKGSIRTGTPTGTVSTVHGLPTYVTKPEGDVKGVVVFIPDIFGWELPNARLLADIYAKEGGFLVYLPDFMNGHSASTASMHAIESLLEPTPLWKTILLKPYYMIRVFIAIVPFLISNSESTVKPRIYNFHTAIRSATETSSLPLGSAGFCWGGKYTILLCQEENVVDAGFTAHPSRMKFPDAFDKIKKPISVSIGDVDLGIKIEEARKIKELLERKEGNEMVILEGAKHGFAVRASPEDEGQMKSAEVAKDQAVAWFSMWFAK